MMTCMSDDGITELISNPSIYLALGIAGLFFGFFFLLIGGLVGTSTGFGGGFYLCAFVGLIPGTICIAMVFKIRKQEQELEQLGDVLQAYRRIPMHEVASKLGVNEFEAETRVAAAIDKGYVKGYIDRNTHEFFTMESMGQVMHLENCPNCGAPREKLHLTGEQVQCEACGTVL